MVKKTKQLKTPQNILKDQYRRALSGQDRKLLSDICPHKTEVYYKSKKNIKMNTRKQITKIISIPTCAATEVLKSLHQNNIECKYTGIDPIGRILMKVSYISDQESLLNELSTYMENSEFVLNEINQAVNEAFQKMKYKYIQENPKDSHEQSIHNKEITVTNLQ